MSEIIDNQPEDKRPVVLLVAAILSFISIGFTTLVIVFNLIGGPMNEDEILETRVSTAKSKTEMRNAGGSTYFINLFDQIQAMIEETNDNFYLSNSLNFMVNTLGFFGVFFMLKRRKFGFHLYIVYSLLALSVLYLYISPQNIPTISLVFGLIFSGLFVFLYSRALRWLK
jgi:hypothetical protein